MGSAEEATVSVPGTGDPTGPVADAECTLLTSLFWLGTN